MLTRRGFTLVELLVSVVLIGIVGLATMSIVRTMMNATTAQVQVATAQGNARTGILALPQELREIGYDTIPTTGATSSDLEAIAANRLTIKAMRGMGVTCGTPTTTEFKIKKTSIIGVRRPVDTDGLLLFLENDPNLGADDQWVPMLVQSINQNDMCGADSAITFTLSAAPIWEPPSTAIAISQHFVGGPIRWYERVEYGPILSGGEAYIGVRSLSLGEGTLTPIIGPLPDTSSFAFTYYNAAGTAVAATAIAPIDVRSIGLSLTTVSTSVASLAGSTKRSRLQTLVTTRIALRNAIRP
jgi:prepilin-type N-terminal cleavage/methylation domain-containing protein